jgi:hypothetical protein
MFSFIPLQYRFAAAMIAAALALSLAFTTGWAVNGWKKDAEHAEVLAVKNATLHEYDLRLVNQNAKVDRLKIMKEAADAVLAQAEARIEVLKKNNKNRQAQAADIDAKDCTSMITKLKAIK